MRPDAVGNGRRGRRLQSFPRVLRRHRKSGRDRHPKLQKRVSVARTRPSWGTSPSGTIRTERVDIARFAEKRSCRHKGVVVLQETEARTARKALSADIAALADEAAS